VSNALWFSLATTPTCYFIAKAQGYSAVLAFEVPFVQKVAILFRVVIMCVPYFAASMGLGYLLVILQDRLDGLPGFIGIGGFGLIGVIAAFGLSHSFRTVLVQEGYIGPKGEKICVYWGLIAAALAFCFTYLNTGPHA
jgi:hypothetical protein